MINSIGEFVVKEITTSKNSKVNLKLPVFNKIYVRQIDSSLFIVIENDFLHIYALGVDIEDAKRKYDNQFIHLIKKVRFIKMRKHVGDKKLFREVIQIKRYLKIIIPQWMGRNSDAAMHRIKKDKLKSIIL